MTVLLLLLLYGSDGIQLQTKRQDGELIGSSAVASSSASSCWSLERRKLRDHRARADEQKTVLEDTVDLYQLYDAVTVVKGSLQCSLFHSSHSTTKFSQLANLTTYTILSLFCLHVEPGPHLRLP